MWNYCILKRSAQRIDYLISAFVVQVMQLNAALQLKKAVILIGPAGCGKTTCSQTLARATNRLNYLLFAPDHSKDELTTNRDLIYYAKNKLKVCSCSISMVLIEINSVLVMLYFKPPPPKNNLFCSFFYPRFILRKNEIHRFFYC